MTRPRFLHSAFALTIASDIELPELPLGGGSPDVDVSVGDVPEAARLSGGWNVEAAPDDVRGWIPSGGAFRVRGGREIVVQPAPDADERAVRLGIVGPLLGVILTQRGRFVLHGSTVAIDDRAVAFVGPSGRGKSTLTAALASAGHALIADDMTVIDTTTSPPRVQPGFPRVKLWPDSAVALDRDLAELPLLHPERTKRSLRIDSNFNVEPLPLARCYLLEDGDEESVTDVIPREMMMALIACTYQSQWLHQTGASGANLLHCGELVKSGVVRRLRRRRSFDALPDVIRFVERDVRSA